jgi:hypothetical protein
VITLRLARPEDAEAIGRLFAANAPARAFYEKHGFVAVEATDGSRNEAGAPDIRYRWSRAG